MDTPNQDLVEITQANDLKDTSVQGHVPRSNEQVKKTSGQIFVSCSEQDWGQFGSPLIQLD